MAEGVVTFNYSAWALIYPELSASVLQTQAQEFFYEAALYLSNTPTSLVRDLNQRAMLLNMLTSHIAAMRASINGQQPSPLVGRISSAGEGSVNVQTTADYPPGSAQWYNSTKYGAAFWQATVALRRMRYIPGPRQPNWGHPW